MSGALLTREAILAADDRKTEDVPVPEWGGTLRLRALSYGDVEDIREQEDAHKLGFGIRILGAAAIDGEGRRLFTDADLAALREKSATVLTRLTVHALRFNRIDQADIEALEGN